MAASSTIINQNNLVEVIKSNSQAMSSIFVAMNDLANTCSTIIKIDTKKISLSLNKINKILPEIYKCITDWINTHNKSISGDISESMAKATNAIGVLKNNLNYILEHVNTIYNDIDKLDVSVRARQKLRRLNVLIRKVYKFVAHISNWHMLSAILKFPVTIVYPIITQIFKYIRLVIDEVNKIHFNILLGLKLKYIKKIIGKLIDVAINCIPDEQIDSMKKSAYKLLLLNIAIRVLSNTLQNLDNIKVLFLNKHIKRIKNAINKLNEIIDEIANINTNRLKSVTKKSWQLTAVITSIVVIMSMLSSSMMLVGPALIAAIVIKSIMRSIGKIVTIIDNIKIDKNVWGELSRLVVTFISINIVLSILSSSLILAVPALVAAVALNPIMLAVGVVVSVINNIKSGKNNHKKILNIITLFSLLFLVLVELTAVAALVTATWKLISIGMISIIAVLGYVALVILSIKLVSKIGIDVKTILSLALISLLVIMIGGVMSVLLVTTKIAEHIKWNFLFKALAMFVVAVTLIAAIGLILAALTMPLVIALGAVLIAASVIGIVMTVINIIIGTIINFAQGLLEIQNIKLDKKVILDKIHIIFDIVGDILYSLRFINLDIKQIKHANKTLRKVNRTVKSLKRLAKSLNNLAEIELNSDKITSQISTIFNVIFGSSGNNNAIVPYIMNMGELLDAKKPTKQVKKVIKHVNKVVGQLRDIADDLNNISNIKLDGNLISNSIMLIFDMVNHVASEVDRHMIPDGATTARAERRMLRQDKKKMRATKKVISKVDEVVLELADIVDSFNKIKNFNIDKAAISNSVSNIFASINEFTNSINNNNIETGNGSIFNKKLDLLTRLSTIVKGFIPTTEEANNHKIFIDENVKLLDKINNIDIEKLKVAESTFAKMAEFSKSINGNFEELANSLNEKIAPLLEELREQMNNVGQKVEKSGADISASAFAASRDSLTHDEQVRQIQRENPNVAEAEQERLAKQRMDDEMKQQNNNLISKLDELIDLFKIGMAQVRMV